MLKYFSKIIQTLYLIVALFSLGTLGQNTTNQTVQKTASPNFDFKDVINIPPSSNGYDPCRFFKIKGDSMYRMGKSNIIGKWNIYNKSEYYEQKKF
jgi:hypothetical protein